MNHPGFEHSDQRIHNAKHRIAQEEHACRCVARLFVDGQEQGTGILLINNWLLTCQHVLPDKNVAASIKSTAQFDYQMLGDGAVRETVQFHFDPTTYCSSLFQSGNDWALVKLKPNPVKGLPSILYGGLRLTNIACAVGDRITIIQHPAGEVKKTAASFLVDLPEGRLLHDVSTEGGSSGSPIFNENWQIVGMHQGCQSGTHKQGIQINIIILGLQSAGSWPLDPGRPEVIDERGPMAHDSPWYIEREADKIAFSHFRKRGITLALRGGTQLGKSSLAARLEHSLKNQGWRSVAIDLRSQFNNPDFSSAHGFFKCMAKKVLAELGGPTSALGVFERDAAASVFLAFLNELGRDAPKPLLLVMDRVDELSGKPCCSSVLTGLRVAHNRHETLGDRGWLKMILITTLKPRQPGPEGSIFDVAKLVPMADFNTAELHQLIHLYGTLRVDAAKLHAFLGGHPAFSRQTLNELADGRLELEEIIQIAKANGGIFRAHLDNVVRAFRSTENGTALANAFRALVKGDPIESEEIFEALYTLGVVNGADAASAQSRCGLYSQWLPSHLPK